MLPSSAPTEVTWGCYYIIIVTPILGYAWEGLRSGADLDTQVSESACASCHLLLRIPLCWSVTALSALIADLCDCMPHDPTVSEEVLLHAFTAVPHLLHESRWKGRLGTEIWTSFKEIPTRISLFSVLVSLYIIDISSASLIFCATTYNNVR